MITERKCHSWFVRMRFLKKSAELWKVCRKSSYGIILQRLHSLMASQLRWDIQTLFHLFANCSARQSFSEEAGDPEVWHGWLHGIHLQFHIIFSIVPYL